MKIRFCLLLTIVVLCATSCVNNRVITRHIQGSPFFMCYRKDSHFGLFSEKNRKLTNCCFIQTQSMECNYFAEEKVLLVQDKRGKQHLIDENLCSIAVGDSFSRISKNIWYVQNAKYHYLLNSQSNMLVEVDDATFVFNQYFIVKTAQGISLLDKQLREIFPSNPCIYVQLETEKFFTRNPKTLGYDMFQNGKFQESISPEKFGKLSNLLTICK